MNPNKEIEQLKQEIRNANYPKYEHYDRRSKELIGTMYLKQKMDYGFHVYYIHEPSLSNPLAGRHGIVSEMFYDLRHKEYWIKRNMKEVKFSVRNVDSIFPYFAKDNLFSFLSTSANQGMYQAAFDYLGKMGEEKREMFGRFFHRFITEHNYFELLYKAGITITEYTYIANRNGTTPMSILGLSKTQWKMVNKYDIAVSNFRHLKNEQADTKMINYLQYIRSLEDEFGLDKVHAFFSYEYNYVYKTGTSRYSALQVAETYNLPVKKFLRYIYFECDVSQGLDVNSAVTEYSDYIRMVNEMEYERFDRYPKFLRTIHDFVSRNYRVNLTDIEKKLWEKSYQNNQKYDYSYKDYKIFPPKEPSDLIKEGNVLCHCVASYIGKVSRGLSTILFLREKQDIDTPLVTIEVKDKRIIQVSGKMNYPPTQEQDMIIKKFAEKFELAM